MALIVLKHRSHGTTFKDNELEAQECERNGWIRVPSVETPLPKREGDDVIEAAEKVIADLDRMTEVAESTVASPLDGGPMTMRERYIQKFGKPPHHRMLPSTIERLVNEPS